MEGKARRSSLEYYREPEGITRIDKHLDFIAWLTDDVRAICQVVQGIAVHDNWLHHYGISLQPEQVYDLLDTIAELSIDPDQSLGEIRSLYASQKGLQPPEAILLNG
jgi:hypothetical protein